jgi:hypothetical protein
MTTVFFLVGLSMISFTLFLNVADSVGINERSTYWRQLQNKSNKLCSLSQRANYTDQATAAHRRGWCKLLRLEGVVWSAQPTPTALFSVFYTGAATISSK